MCTVILNTQICKKKCSYEVLTCNPQSQYSCSNCSCCSTWAQQGKIACANVLSDLYAMGVTECDNMLMLLASSQKMSDKERDVVLPLMIRGFKVGVGDDD